MSQQKFNAYFFSYIPHNHSKIYIYVTYKKYRKLLPEIGDYWENMTEWHNEFKPTNTLFKNRANVLTTLKKLNYF